MQTDTVEAWQIEEGDYITLGGEDVFRVAQKDDLTTSIRLVLKDDDDWSEEEFEFASYEALTIVTSFDADTDAANLLDNLALVEAANEALALNE